MNNDNIEKVFGPYDDHPSVHISYNEGSSLKRIIYEEDSEIPVQVQESKAEENKNSAMTWKQLVLYYTFLYTPGKEGKPKSQPKNQIIERKIIVEEVLCESVAGFEITEQDGKYYVHARTRNA